MTVAQRKRASAMLGAKGQAVTIAGIAASTYDPATGTVASDPTSVSTSGVLLPLDKARKIDGTNIKAGDETLLLSALDASGAAYDEPAINSVVTLATGAKRTIVAIDTLAPAGLAIMYDTVVRRAA